MYLWFCRKSRIIYSGDLLVFAGRPVPKKCTGKWSFVCVPQSFKSLFKYVTICLSVSLVPPNGVWTICRCLKSISVLCQFICVAFSFYVPMSWRKTTFRWYMVERVMKTAVDRVDGLIPRTTFTVRLLLLSVWNQKSMLTLLNERFVS